MKAILALEHSIIPPTIGFVNLNPNSKPWVNPVSGAPFTDCGFHHLFISRPERRPNLNCY